MATGSHFVKKFKKKKNLYWSKMARNVIQSDFRTSKMAAGSHFVKKFTKIKIVVFIWNGKKCDTKLFLDIQNGYRQPFYKKNIYKKSCESDLNNVRTDCWPTTTYKLNINSLLVNIHIHTDSYVGNEGIYIGRMHTILVIFCVHYICYMWKYIYKLTCVWY